MSDSAPPRVEARAWVVTGPTSGIGRQAALELAKHGTVVLVGRDRRKLAEVEKALQARRGRAVSVVCDLSDVTSARRAASQIAALGLPLAGLLNNAGIFPTRPFQTAQGWDGTFATDHLGPFAFTEALMPALPDRAHVVFVCSGVEDPERRPAVIAGFRGGRYLSAEASARGEWAPGGSKLPGGDAYATAKQCNLATALAFAREFPRLRFNAVEPGFSPRQQPRARREPCAARPVEVRAVPDRAAYQVLEHSEESRSHDHGGPHRRQRPDRGLLRREGAAHARLGARA